VRIDLPSGGWAELSDPAIVIELKRRPVQRAMSRISAEGWATLQAQGKVQAFEKREKDALEPTGEERELAKAMYSEADVDALSTINDLAVAALVTEWSFDAPITVEAVLNRQGNDYDKLRAECAPAVAQMFLNTSPSKDESSPTKPSSESATSWREATSAETSRTSSEPTESSS
jgi:hypothetical protein